MRAFQQRNDRRRDADFGIAGKYRRTGRFADDFDVRPARHELHVQYIVAVETVDAQQLLEWQVARRLDLYRVLARFELDRTEGGLADMRAVDRDDRFVLDVADPDTQPARPWPHFQAHGQRVLVADDERLRDVEVAVFLHLDRVVPGPQQDAVADRQAKPAAIDVEAVRAGRVDFEIHRRRCEQQKGCDQQQRQRRADDPAQRMTVFLFDRRRGLGRAPERLRQDRLVGRRGAAGVLLWRPRDVGAVFQMHVDDGAVRVVGNAEFAAEKPQPVAAAESTTRIERRTVDLERVLAAERLDEQLLVEQVEQRKRFATRSGKAQLAVAASADFQRQLGGLDAPFPVDVTDTQAAVHTRFGLKWVPRRKCKPVRCRSRAPRGTRDARRGSPDASRPRRRCRA